MITHQDFHPHNENYSGASAPDIFLFLYVYFLSEDEGE